MPITWAYDMNNEELMENLLKATSRAAVSGSGLVIDFMRSSHQSEAFYFYGVVLSRLEGTRPPFMRGERVRIDPKATYYCGSVNTIGEHSTTGEAKPGKDYEVVRVYFETRNCYDIGGKQYLGWTLALRDKKNAEFEDYRFPAERFKRVKVKQPAAA